jgi:hypothetical protein
VTRRRSKSSGGQRRGGPGGGGGAGAGAAGAGGGGRDFWGPAPSTVDGRADDSPAPARRVRPTPDPGAVPRSLGEPPLPARAAAQQHLAVVYAEAVRAAVALAGANGLLELDE